MQIKRVRKIIIKLIIAFTLITILNFLITAHIKSNYILLNRGINKDSSLNEEFYQIGSAQKKITKESLINDIENIERVYAPEYEASAQDIDLTIDYYKKIYNIYDGRLQSIYNEIYSRIKSEGDRQGAYNNLYNFKIERINNANELTNTIIDNKQKIGDYYKSLMEQTRAKCIEFIDNYAAFLDN